jgi:uncharacterized protein YukE
MALVSLTPAEAEAKIGAIDVSRDDIVATLRKLQARQQEMLGSGWHGAAAKGYDVSSQAAAQDYDRLISFLLTTCETAKTNIRELISNDA